MRSQSSRSTAAAIVLVALFAAPLQGSDDPDAIETPAGNSLENSVETLVRPLLEDRPHLGLVVGVTRDGDRQVFGYGRVTLDGRPQVPSEDTIFEIGSITKVFTGVLLADLVRSKRLRLEDSLQRHLPAELVVPRGDDREITLLDLATHTSGLPVQPPRIGLFALARGDPANPYEKYGQAELRATLQKLHLNRPVGSRFEYSNLGVGLLGQAVARAAKEASYEELLVRRLTGPLGMNDTRIRLAAGQRKRLAGGHTIKGKPTSEWTFASLEACGGLRSTVRDLLIFAEANLGRPESQLGPVLRMAQAHRRDTGRNGESVGLCWMRQQLKPAERLLLWHNGGTGGYRSFLGCIPTDRVGVVVLSNSALSVDALGMGVLELLKSDR